MPEFSVAALPEVFVSDTAISKSVYEAVERGDLRRLGSRLYTKNLDEQPEEIVRRNWYYLLNQYYPDALITDRTALENQPASDGSVFLISAKKREIAIPGLTFRPRKGPEPLEGDRPFIGGARLASPARAYLENLSPSRTRAGRVSRTLKGQEIEERLDALIRRQGKEAINRLRDEARRIAPQLGLEAQFGEFDRLVGALLGTRNATVNSAIGRARAGGHPFDPDRIRLFEILFAALRESVPLRRPAAQRMGTPNTNLSFFEAYFSNFIEGTEFTVDEASAIVFQGVVGSSRVDLQACKLEYSIVSPK